GGFGAWGGATEVELRANDADVVGCRGGGRPHAGDGRAGGRRGDGYRGRCAVVGHGHADGRGGRTIAGSIAGNGGERVGAIGRGGRRPRHGVRRGRGFGAEIGAIEFEL